MATISNKRGDIPRKSGSTWPFCYWWKFWENFELWKLSIFLKEKELQNYWRKWNKTSYHQNGRITLNQLTLYPIKTVVRGFLES